MQGHIRPRGPNTWQLIWYVGRKPDGRPDYRSCTVHGDRAAAEGKLAQILASMFTGEYVAPSRETIGAFLLRWLEEIRPAVRPKTFRSYEQHCRNHLIPLLGSVPLAKLTALQIQRAYRQMLEDGRRAKGWGGEQGDGLSPTSVAGIHRVLRRALNQAVKWGLLARNPCVGVEPPKPQPRQYVILTPEQADRLLEAAAPTGRRSLYLAAMTLGCRQGELLGLRWGDVDLEAGTATIQQELERGGANPKFSPPKTRAGTRTITLPASLVAELRVQRELESQERSIYDGEFHDYDLIWHAAGGNPLMPRNVDRQFKKLLKQAGLPENMRFHDLRHTSASWLLKMGVHPKVVQERLGHSQVSVTLGIYSHVLPGLQEQVAVDIDKLLAEGRDRAKK